jgi:hypothetical protein
MSVSFKVNIRCDNWLGGNDSCETLSAAEATADGYVPTAPGWVTVQLGQGDCEGEYYCASCAAERGIDE